MKKIFIHYFTGTANTAHAISLIKAELEKSAHIVRSRRIEHEAVPPALTWEDLYSP